MSSSRSSRLLLVLLVALVCAVGIAAGVSVSDESTPTGAQVGANVEGSYTLTELYQDPSYEEWTLRTSTELQNVTWTFRLVDQAGNVGPATDPLPIILDNRGPRMTAAQIEGWLEGTARDGSGVASVSLSLDGGAYYQPVAVEGEVWSFELSSWAGSWPESFAMLRAVDLWGNITRELLPVEMEHNELYLPLILKGGG